MKKRILAVIVVSLMLSLSLLSVSATEWYGWDGFLDKSREDEGLWTFKWYQADSWYRSYAFFVDDTGTSGMSRTSRDGYFGFYFDTITDWASAHWVTYDLPLFMEGAELNSDNSNSYLYTNGLNLSGLPRGVEITVTLNITGSMSYPDPDNVYPTVELYDIPANYKFLMKDYMTYETSMVKRVGTKLDTTLEVNPQGSGGTLTYKFISSGDDFYNFAIVFNRFASLTYNSPYVVLPEISFTFTTEQGEEIVQIMQEQLSVTKKIATALEQDEDFQRAIDHKREEQSQQIDDFSEALNDMSVGEIDFSVPEISLPSNDTITLMMDTILSFNGVGMLLSVVVSLWIVGLVLFGKREGGNK